MSPSHLIEQWVAMRDEAYLIEALKRSAGDTVRSCIGEWVEKKYRTQAASRGTQHAALNMKKQGVPIELALAVLARRSSS